MTAAAMICAGACTANTLTPPLPGQHWPEQGGHYVGVMRSDDGLSAWHLVLPSGPEYDLGRNAWGEYGQNIEGAGNRFDGYANTLAMAEAGSPLAQKIRALPGDCHLPSRAEAALCFAIVPELFEPGWYWTSTQYSDNYAWNQDFSYGTQDDIIKSYEARCRAVRRLVLQSFNPSDGGAS